MQGHLAFSSALRLVSGSFSAALPLQPSHRVLPKFSLSDSLSAQCVVPRMICTTSVNIATVITLPATSAHLPIWLDGLQAVLVVFVELPTCVFRTREEKRKQTTLKTKRPSDCCSPKLLSRGQRSEVHSVSPALSCALLKDCDRLLDTDVEIGRDG